MRKRRTGLAVLALALLGAPAVAASQTLRFEVGLPGCCPS